MKKEERENKEKELYKPKMNFIPEGKYQMPDSRVAPDVAESILQSVIAAAEQQNADAQAAGTLNLEAFEDYDGVTPLEQAMLQKIEGLSQKQIETMLLADWRDAYKVDFSVKLNDSFDLKLGVERYNLSALIYPRCFRKIIKSLNLRSSVRVRYQTKADLKKFEGTKFWKRIASAIKLYPHDDFYMVIPNENLN